MELGISTDDDKFPFLLLGNKSDLPEKAVPESTAREFASKNSNMLFYEVSSKTSENIKEAFKYIVQKAIFEDDLEVQPKNDFQIFSSLLQFENKPNKLESIESKDDASQKLQTDFEMQLEKKNKELDSLKEEFELKIK